jgi:hypothetical protein
MGMAAAGLADVIDVRTMVLICGMLVGATGVIALILPGIGTPTSQWRQKLALLRAAPAQAASLITRPAEMGDFEVLVAHLPLLGELQESARQGFLAKASVLEVEQGAAVVRQGERGRQAYFIMAGMAVAGATDVHGQVYSLSTMGPGDFFGEIAALTDTPRTADVVAETRLTLLQVPEESLHAAMTNPRLRYLFLSKLTDRLATTHMADLPRLRGLDQVALRELRLKVD